MIVEVQRDTKIQETKIKKSNSCIICGLLDGAHNPGCPQAQPIPKRTSWGLPPNTPVKIGDQGAGPY